MNIIKYRPIYNLTLIINENNYSLTDLAISMSSGDSIRSSDPVINVTSPVFSPYSSVK